MFVSFVERNRERIFVFSYHVPVSLLQVKHVVLHLIALGIVGAGLHGNQRHLALVIIIVVIIIVVIVLVVLVIIVVVIDGGLLLAHRGVAL